MRISIVRAACGLTAVMLTVLLALPCRGSGGAGGRSGARFQAPGHNGRRDAQAQRFSGQTDGTDRVTMPIGARRELPTWRPGGTSITSSLRQRQFIKPWRQVLDVSINPCVIAGDA